MNLDLKAILWLLAMGFLYAMVGLIGYWLPPVYLFTCFLGIPYSLYIYKKGIDISSFLMPASVTLILVIMGIEEAAITCGFLLFIPSFICGIYYNKQAKLPKNIIILSVGYFFSWIGMLVIWKSMYSIKVIPDFFALTQMIEENTLNQLSHQLQLAIESVQNAGKTSFGTFGQDPKKFIEGYSIYRLAVRQSIYLMQYYFPVMIFVLGFFASLVQVLLTKLMLKALNWKSPSIKSITDIGFTPLTVGLVGLTWIIRSDMSKRIYPILTMAADNVLVIFALFMFVIGILFTIHVITNSKAGNNWKIIVAILSFFSIIVSPFLFVVLGCFEAIFNFRKTERFL